MADSNFNDPFSMPDSGKSEPKKRSNAGTDEKNTLEISTQELMPTIIIGLGGSGKEVLLRIRRQFAEKYGSLQGFPIISFLYIDTDNAPSEESGLARERDYLINEIDFQPSEKIFHSVNPSDYIFRIQDVPHVKEWLSTTGEIAKLGTMNTGAGQIRPAARLAFFHNYDEIVSKLTAAKSLITDSRSINIVKDKHKIKNVNTEKINVYVISSVSGGTGSGMFLDMGFLIKKIFKNQAVSSCYLFLPQIYQAYGKERVYANGYAALKELEYYNFKNHFNVSWKKNEPHSFPAGVYDDIYLIDGENTKNLSLSDSSNRDIYKMLADSIFQDFSNSDFANYKRGVRVNLVQYKQRFYPEDSSVDDNTFSRKYSTLGQATISIPVDRIITSCSYKLCEDIIDYYLTFAEGSESEIDTYLLQNFLPEVGILESHTRNQLLDSLYKISDTSSVQNEIRRTLNNIKDDFTSGKKGDNWTQLLLNIKERFDTNFRDDNDVNRLGLYYKQVNSNRNKILSEVIGDRESNHLGTLERKINSLVNDSTRGVFYAVKLLQRLQFILTESAFDYIPKFEKEIKDLQALATFEDSQIKSKIQELREDETRSKMNILRKSAMVGNLEKLISHLERYYSSLIKLKARQHALDISKKILELIERKEKTDNGKVITYGLISDLNKLTGNLGILKQNYIRKYNFFKQKNDTSFNLNVYDPDDIKNEYYVRYIGTGSNAQDRLKELSNRLLKEMGASDVTDIVNILRESDAKAVEEKMVSFCRQPFEKIREDYNVTDILFEKDTIRSESKIRGMFLQAFPWLRTREIPGSFKLDDSAKKYYIGIKTNSPAFSKFRGLIQSIVGSNIEFKDSGDNSSITFYSEWAGFPLFFSYTIAEELKSQYKQLQQNLNVDLHINKNAFIFNDIIPLNEDEKKRLNETYRAYIMGVIFGVFDVIPESDNSKAIYKYTTQEGITVKKTKTLGIESKLINQLFEEKGKDALRYKILKDAENIKESLTRNEKLAEMLVIFEYYYSNIYKPEEIEISGEAKKEVETYPYKIVRNLARELENIVDAGKSEEFAVNVRKLREDLNSISFLTGDGSKRTIDTKKLLSSGEKNNQSSITDSTKRSDFPNGNSSIDLGKLREYKLALDEGLISKEEFEQVKQNFLKINK
ncbi:tubulin-like doman-containing protein [soil metagenome]